jgi:hypothetical protein
MYDSLSDFDVSCFRTRQYQEQLIEFMMRANEFRHVNETPPETLAGDDHSFLKSSDNTSFEIEYTAHLPERKEWQPPLPPQNTKDVFVRKKQQP